MRTGPRRKTVLAERRFDTTKGKLLMLLCRVRRTVADLAVHLGVTDNAVRAQIQRLERDGLAVKVGSRRGTRRPHVEYELTSRARKLFPRAYEPLLQNLVDVLTDRLPANQCRQVLVEAGDRLLRHHFPALRGSGPNQRIAEVMETLNGSSFGIEVTEEAGKTVICSCSCPLASVTAAHPELCELLAHVLGEVLNADVRERCERGDSPRCFFEIQIAREKGKRS